MKFGGTSVADMDRIKNVAAHVKREVNAGNQIVVVLSAMAGTTNQLIDWTRQAAGLHDAREYDVVVSAGEQISVGLMAIVLQDAGIAARSWLGWQIPIETNDVHGSARITHIDQTKLVERLERNEVVVVPGFQGIGPDNRITTLGRGGSDTSAVAIAAAVKADRCDIYTDVDGVYTSDPRVVTKARRLDKIAYEEMLEMASLGAKVLQTRSVELAMVQKVHLLVRSSFDAPDAPQLIDGMGTLVCDEDEIVEKQLVSGIAYSKDEAKVTLVKVADKPGVAAAIFGPLSDANINVDMIVQNVSDDGKHTDVTFTVSNDDLERAINVVNSLSSEMEVSDIVGTSDLVKISVIGSGMRSHAGVAATMFKTLAERGINIQVITTSEIKVSILIDAEYAELAVRALHTVYGLDDD
jgi:aspartate kinase